MTHTKLRTSVFRLANKGWQNGEKSNRLSKKKKKKNSNGDTDILQANTHIVF